MGRGRCRSVDCRLRVDSPDCREEGALVAAAGLPEGTAEALAFDVEAGTEVVT